jgi:two-component system chemotaxis response regulator CheB
MVIENGLIRLELSPRQNLFRPCIDVLFRPAAATYGRRVIGVLLSGANGIDGPPGLWQVKHRGGVTIVQDPGDAQFPGMPTAALANVAVDHVLPAAQIGPALLGLASSPGAAASRRALRILGSERRRAPELRPRASTEHHAGAVRAPTSDHTLAAPEEWLEWLAEAQLR